MGAIKTIKRSEINRDTAWQLACIACHGEGSFPSYCNVVSGVTRYQCSRCKGTCVDPDVTIDEDVPKQESNQVGSIFRPLGLTINRMRLRNGIILEWLDGPVMTTNFDWYGNLYIGYLAESNTGVKTERWVYYRPSCAYCRMARSAGVVVLYDMLQSAVDGHVFLLDKDHHGVYRTAVLNVDALPADYLPEQGEEVKLDGDPFSAPWNQKMVFT